MKMKKLIAAVVAAVVVVVLIGAFLYNLPKEPYSGYDYSDYVKLSDYKQIIADGGEKDQERLWQEIVVQSEIVKYPRKEMKSRKEQLEDYYQDLAKSYGYKDFDKFLKKELSYSQEEYEESIESHAEGVVGEELVVHAIAEKEKLQVSAKEYNAHLQTLMDEAGYNEEEFEEAYGCTIEEYGTNNRMRTALLKEKVIGQIFK